MLLNDWSKLKLFIRVVLRQICKVAISYQADEDSTVAAKKILTWRNSVEAGKCYHGCLIFRYKHIMLISVDASWREKHIGTIPSALSLFYQKLEAKNECDLI